MDAKAQIFLSSLPLLCEYVTLVGEITTSGPHLLNCACCRALLRLSTDIITSPVINDKKRVFIVIHKNEVKKKDFLDNVAACNLKLVKVLQLTNSVLQFCLDFTIHTYLHPNWTRVDNRYFEGKTCLFQNHWMGCVRAQINIQDKSVIIALKATQVKLIVARLSTFNIREDTVQKFMKKEIRTINSVEMGDNTCYVLPSFKPALVHSISYDIDKRCPLKDRSDMISYWLDYHGMLIPSDTDIFVTLSFNFPGAPIMTYPYYCVRKSFAITKQCTDNGSIDSFINEVNSITKARLPSLGLHFPIKPCHSTAPDVSNNCLVNKPDDGPRYTHNETNVQRCNYEVKNKIDKRIIMPIYDTIRPNYASYEKVTDLANCDHKIKPRFAPYQRTSITKGSSNTSTDKVAEKTSKLVPSFKTMVSSKGNSNSASDLGNATKNNMSGDKFGDISANLTSNGTCKLPRNPAPNILSNKVPQKSPPPNRLSQSRVSMTPKCSWSDTKSSQGKTCNQIRTPESVHCSFDQDDFDDFEVPLSLNYLDKSPNTQTSSMKTPTLTPKQSPIVYKSQNPSPVIKTPIDQRKPRATPKILDDEQVSAMFRLGQITKVNNQSLSAFLKNRGVKGTARMKKGDLINVAAKFVAGGIVHEP